MAAHDADAWPAFFWYSAFCCEYPNFQNIGHDGWTTEDLETTLCMCDFSRCRFCGNFHLLHDHARHRTTDLWCVWCDTHLRDGAAVKMIAASEHVPEPQPGQAALCTEAALPNLSQSENLTAEVRFPSNLGPFVRCDVCGQMVESTALNLHELNYFCQFMLWLRAHGGWQGMHYDRSYRPGYVLLENDQVVYFDQEKRQERIEEVWPFDEEEEED